MDQHHYHPIDTDANYNNPNNMNTQAPTYTVHSNPNNDLSQYNQYNPHALNDINNPLNYISSHQNDNPLFSDTSTSFSTSRFLDNDPNSIPPPSPPSLAPSLHAPPSPPSPYNDPEAMFKSILNQPDGEGKTAIYHSVERNRVKSLEVLLAFRADPNICDKKGITPLRLACQLGHQTAIRILLRHNADCIQEGPDLLGLIWGSIPDLGQRAEVLASLVTKGATCYPSLYYEISKLDAYNQFIFQQALRGQFVIEG